VLRNRVWNESRALVVNVPVAGAALSMRVEPLRDHQVKVVLRARHCDIKKPTLFFDLGS
jgi:hypothetical protein